MDVTPIIATDGPAYQQTSRAEIVNKQNEKELVGQRYSSFMGSQNNGGQAKKQQPQPIRINMFEQKINKAIQLKNSGNAYFKKKQFLSAVKQYSTALQLLDPSHFYGATRAQCQKMSELSSNLLCNMGFCYFNINDMKRAQIFLSQAIIINPKYAKALHKRALARYQLEKYQQAFDDVKLAFSLDGTSTQIHTSYSKILEKYNDFKKKNKQKMKQISAKMFNASTNKVESPEKKKSKQEERKNNQSQHKNTNQNQKKSWSWPSLITFVGAAAFIGTGIYKAFKG